MNNHYNIEISLKTDTITKKTNNLETNASAVKLFEVAGEFGPVHSGRERYSRNTWRGMWPFLGTAKEESMLGLEIYGDEYDSKTFC